MDESKTGLTQAQLDAYWMPFTGNRQFKSDPRMITSADGCYYTDGDGRKIFDGLSGLWTCGFGHNIKAINQAIGKQSETLDFSPTFQFGHKGAFELAERITQFMPAGIDRVFFCGSGSEAADTALKIARGYWRAKGQASKTRLIGRAKGYHGVNFGGISVGGIGGNRASFGEGIASDHLRHTWLAENAFTPGVPDKGAERADDLLDLIALHDASNIAAVIVEPLAGSAGVFPPPVGYLKRLREICDQHDILLIFDEVITAFGRMGANTGSEAFGVTPDIINVAKQLTNGAMPMGAVVVKRAIYDCFMDTKAPEYALEVPHGYTYSAHPLACAAGLAALQILEDESMIERVQAIAPVFEKSIHELGNAPRVVDIRNYGLAGGLTLAPYEGEPLRRPFEVAMSMWKKGFYVRYGGDTIQLGLPFVVKEQEVTTLMSALGDSLSECA
ncbi:MAG: aspartate aminotransferase family protein [Pseudomonadales bacterium]|nr:aspartate aminotransferase family protein [Pseudomonadales bacterium]